MARTYPRILFNDGAVEFSDSDIREASIVEEFSPYSITVPINKLEVTLYSEDANFSILNPSGDYALLKYRAPMAVYEVVEGSEQFIGQYYLEGWENISDTLIKLECIDDLGVLDGLTYFGGIWLEGITAGELLEDLFLEIDTEYDIDPGVADTELSGWIPVCSYREALQQIAFACGAYVLCARQGRIKIGVITGSAGVLTRGIRSGVAGAGQSKVWQRRWRQSQWEGVEPIYEITEADQGIDTSVDLRPLVTGVVVSMHDIVVGTGEKTLFEGTLTDGNHTIIFSQPMHSLSVTGATISESGANYAILNVASEGEVELTGLVYVDTVTEYGVYMSGLSGVKENVVKITDASLVNSTNGETIAQAIYDYYQRRHRLKTKLFMPDVIPGSEVLVETLYDSEISGVVEKMDVDLSSGFVAQTEIIGELEDTSSI